MKLKLAPKKEGFWYEKEEMVKSPSFKNYICSNCKKEHFATKYCPYCGSRNVIFRAPTFKF